MYGVSFYHHPVMNPTAPTSRNDLRRRKDPTYLSVHHGRVHALCEHRGSQLLLSHLGAAAVAADGHLALDSRPRLHLRAEMQSVGL